LYQIYLDGKRSLEGLEEFALLIARAIIKYQQISQQ
jgi:hypothetical protein